MYAGSCVQHLNGMPIEVKEGQALLIDQNTRHKVPHLGEGQILLNLFFGADTIPALLEQLRSPHSIVYDFLANSMRQTARKDSFILFDAADSWKLRSLVVMFGCDFLEQEKCRRRTPHPAVPAHHDGAHRSVPGWQIVSLPRERPPDLGPASTPGNRGALRGHHARRDCPADGRKPE